MFSESTAPHLAAVLQHFAPPPGIAPGMDSLFSRQPTETFKANATIFWEGDATTHVYQVLEGVLRIVKILSGGRRAITGFVYSGDLLGISLRTPHFSTAETVTPTRIRRLGRTQFRDAMQHSPELRLNLLQRLCEDAAAADDRMVLLARKTAEERVCSFLLMMARRMRRDCCAGATVAVPMCRLDLADYLGLTKETVCRTMARLAGLGLITTTGRHGVTICALESLAFHAGDGESDALRDGHGLPRRLRHHAGECDAA